MSNAARGQALMDELEENIVLVRTKATPSEKDFEETVYINNQHFYIVTETWGLGRLPKGIPDVTRQWLSKFGVFDRPDIDKISIRARNPSNPEADPTFEAYLSIGGGWMFITYMNRDPKNTDNIFASNHEVGNRAHMSEWIYRVWKHASSHANHQEYVVPALNEVVIANIKHVGSTATIEALKLDTGSNEGELYQGSNNGRFEQLFAMGLVGATVNALINMSEAFSGRVPARIAWRSGDQPYIGEGHDGEEIHLEDRFLVISLKRMTDQRFAEVKARMVAGYN